MRRGHQSERRGIELKPGYKQTEVGVIPEDWESIRLGEICDFTQGVQIAQVEQSRHQWEGYIRYLYIRDFFTDDFPWYVRDIYQTKIMNKNDIMMVNTGNTAGQVYSGKYGVLSNNAFKITRKSKRIIRDYLLVLLRSFIVQNSVQTLFNASGQPHVGHKNIAQVKIPLPPTKAEQEAIAEVLSDADTLIESLEQLLAKKRDIKHGAMQELLRPKEGWARKRIGEVLTISHGKSQHEIVDKNGIYPILATGGQIGNTNRFLYNKPSVLIGRKGTIDRPQYMDQPFWTVDTLFYSVISEPNDAKYLFYQFCLIDWKQYNEASGVPSLNARTIEAIEIEIPTSEEQTAIAAILSELDTEIAALEGQLAKARQMKQGMMQELLTGRIRLV